MTVVYKRGYPLVYFGFIAYFIAKVGYSEIVWRDAIFIGFPCLLAVGLFFLMKKTIWDLADEVEDGGDFLLVRMGGRQERVELANILNAWPSSARTNPPRITLQLAEPGTLGAKIAFSPASNGFLTLIPFSPNKIADDLIARVDQVRSHRAARQGRQGL
jgi:hypothetical protein